MISSPGASAPMVSVRDMRKSYGSIEAVRGISFDVAAGEIFVQLQSSAFPEHFTTREMVDLFALFYRRKVDALGLLRTVGLEDRAGQLAEKLSGGQRQRLSIAVAMVNDPRVLFLDEPTTGLDPQARRNLWDLIREIRGRGTTVLLTTHYMEEAEVLCDRVAIMDAGRIIALDPPRVLVAQLLARGFSKPVVQQQADLEDVFLEMTGHALREE